MLSTEGYYGAVVFLDRLGTKGIWKKGKTKEIIQDYESFLALIRRINSESNETVNEVKKIIGTAPTFEVKTFSDTIIITIAVPEENKGLLRPHDMVAYAGAILPAIIPRGIAAEIYLRGAISVGSFYKGENIMIGPAIDEAAQYHNLTEWIGVSAAPSAHYILNNTKVPDARDYFSKWDISIKNGLEKNGWAVNWPAVFNDFEIVEDKETWVELLKSVTATLKAQLQNNDVSVALKWRNTYDYFANHFHPTQATKVALGK